MSGSSYKDNAFEIRNKHLFQFSRYAHEKIIFSLTEFLSMSERKSFRKVLACIFMQYFVKVKTWITTIKTL